MTDIPVIRTRLLRDNIGGHLSILITLPGGDLLAADIRASDRRRLEQIYDLVEAPDDEQNFETCRVLILENKEEVKS